MNSMSNLEDTTYDFRNTWLFILGKGVSVFGSSIYSFAISLYILSVTGSPLSFATNLLLSVLPIVFFSPIAGVISDRFHKKHLIIAMDLLCGVTFICLFLLPHLSLTTIYLTSLLLTTCSTLFGIAIESAKPNLVSASKLIALNATGKMIDSLSTILGPILGGMAYAWIDIRSFILINAVSFILSVITECFFVFQNDEKTVASSAWFSDLKEGIYYFYHSAELVKFAGVFMFINFFLGFSIQVPMPFLVNEVFKLPASAYGVISSAFPIGLIIGASFIEKLMKRFHYGSLVSTAIFMMTIVSTGLVIPFAMGKHLNLTLPITIIYTSSMALLGISIALIDLPLIVMLQSQLPQYIRGRVMGLVSSIAKVILPISLVLSGFLLEAVPSFIMPLIGALLSLIYGLILRQRFAKDMKKEELTT